MCAENLKEKRFHFFSFFSLVGIIGAKDKLGKAKWDEGTMWREKNRLG